MTWQQVEIITIKCDSGSEYLANSSSQAWEMSSRWESASSITKMSSTSVSPCLCLFPSPCLSLSLNLEEYIYIYLGFPGGASSSESACQFRRREDESWIPESGRSPGEGNGSPLQYSCLENSMDRGAWWAIVRGIAKSQTWPSNWARMSYMYIYKYSWHDIGRQHNQ